MFDVNNPTIQFAIQTVRQAATLVQQIQAEIGSAGLTKADLSPVTVADFTAQALVGHQLAETFPHDHMIAEEDSAALRKPENTPTLQKVTTYTSRVIPTASPDQVCKWIDHGFTSSANRYWTLDPIDGTKGFLRGDQYAIAFALVESGQVKIGVLGCPTLSQGYMPDREGPGSIIVAVHGQGAWASPLHGEPYYQPLSVSHQKDPTQAHLLGSYVSAHTNTQQIDRFAETLGITTETVRMDSQAKYSVLAAGQGEIYLRLLSPDKPNYWEKIWDQAAGSLIVFEAGGRVTDLDGKSLDFTLGSTLAANRGILATNGLLHEAALEALQAIQA